MQFIHAVHPFILRQWLRVRLCGPPPARVAIDRPGSRLHIEVRAIRHTSRSAGASSYCNSELSEERLKYYATQCTATAISRPAAKLL